MKIESYAKINFRLNVLGERPDGYHEVETLMQAIALHDDVFVDWEENTGAPECAPCFSITLAPGRDDLPADSGNLAYRAATLMHDVFRPMLSGRVVIRIVKRIPVAAGLAGGSGNAAAVMNALGEIWGIPLEDRISAGARLGADVPFCIASQNGITAAIGLGTGADLSPAKPCRCKVLLTTPDISVPTKAVYGALEPADWATPFIGFGNHLQAPALRLFPEIQEVLDLHKALPGQVLTQLSGSGPSVFTLFDTDAEIPEYTHISSRFHTVLTETLA